MEETDPAQRHPWVHIHPGSTHECSYPSRTVPDARSPIPFLGRGWSTHGCPTFPQRNRKRRNRKKKKRGRGGAREGAPPPPRGDVGDPGDTPPVEIEYITEEPEIYDPNFVFFKRIFEAFKVGAWGHPVGAGGGGSTRGCLLVAPTVGRCLMSGELSGIRVPSQEKWWLVKWLGGTQWVLGEVTAPMGVTRLHHWGQMFSIRRGWWHLRRLSGIFGRLATSWG